MNAPAPQQLVEHALEATRSENCVVILNDSTSANLRWANNTMTTNGVMHTSHMTVVALQGPGSASLGGTVSTAEQVDDLVAAADAAAREARPAEDAAPLPRDRVSEDWSDPPAGTSISVYDAFAPALRESFTRAEAGGRLLYGFVDHEVTTTYLASSTGLRLRHDQPTGHYGCTGRTGDGSAWVGGATRDFADVDAAALDDRLAHRLSWGERRVDLPPGRYDTVLPPAAVADLLVYAYWSASARVAHDGQSVFSRPGGGTRIGEQIVRPEVSVFSDPAFPGLECAPFVMASVSSEATSVYDNGLPLARTPWVDEGSLTSLLQTRHSAALTGQPVTPVVDNLVLEVAGAGADTPEEMAAGMNHGLLLTCLWYIREVDPQTLLLTGLTRDGVYLVEGGEITAAVNNFRFNESPVDLLHRFGSASRTAPSFSREWGDEFSRTATPALRVPDFNMSSVSQAR